MWQRGRAEAARFDVLESIDSTNSELIRRTSSGDEPDFSVILSTGQTAGRGRLGRQWIAPKGKTIAVSVLLRPTLPAGEPLDVDHFGWLPLIAGVAMATAVEAVIPRHRVGLKWPNDVQVDGLKVAGLLAELAPTGDAVVIGAGLNVSIGADELPTPTSTSLELSGASLEGDELADVTLAAFLRTLRTLYTEFVRLGADAEASGIHQAVTESCTTLGQQVRVDLPGGENLYGTATGIDRSGRLEVRRSSDGHTVTVAAGDITHLRYE